MKSNEIQCGGEGDGEIQCGEEGEGEIQFSRKVNRETLA